MPYGVERKSTMATKVIHRSSQTGRIVTERYAEKHPGTTERERVQVPAPKPPPHKGK
jgi:hypothetical protein